MKNFILLLFFLVAVLLILVMRGQVYDQLEIPSEPLVNQTDDGEITNPLQLHFHERRPFYVKYKDNVYGLVAGPVGRILEQADIEFEWVETPAGRQLEIIRKDASPICAVGWFKTPQRQRYAKFSLPVYQDRKLVAVTRNDNDRMNAEEDLERVFSDRRLRLLVKSGYSYGAYISKKLELLEPWMIDTTADNVGMLEMIKDMRADYCFMSEEEAYDLLVNSSLDRSAFKIIQFRDVPEGSKRYLLCSRNVDEATMDRINSAIAHFINVPAGN